MKIINIFRTLLICGVAVVAAAGCSTDKTEYSTEVSFKGGDGAYVCDAAGGSKDISFYSQCGHWEITVPEDTAEWLTVWPLFGDDNGKTNLTVTELKSAYGRRATLDIVTDRGVVGQVVVSQQGAAPYILFDLLSDRIRVDYQGTPVTVNIASNLKWKPEILTAEGEAPANWIRFGEQSDTSLQLLFDDNTGLPKRECLVRFRMVEGDYYVDLPVVQRAGNGLYEHATEKRIADLLAEVQLDSNSSFEIEGNYVVKAYVTSDFVFKNLPDSVMYLQDESGRGLKLLLKDKGDFVTAPADRLEWYSTGRKLSVHVCGLEFRKDTEGNLAIYDVPASVVMASEESPNGAGALAVALRDFASLADYANTLVKIDPVEFVSTDGCYGNFFENQNMTTVGNSWTKDVSAEYKITFAHYRLMPQLLRDTQGRITKLWFSHGFTRKWSKNLPQGKGALSGIVSLFRGEPILQIRSDADETIAAKGDRIAATLLKAGAWVDNTKTSVLFEKGNADGDASSMAFSVKNSVTGGDDVKSGAKTGLYWLDAAIRNDHTLAWTNTDSKRLLSLNAINWWSVTGSGLSNAGDAGEAFVLRTNTLRNTSGKLWLSFATTSSLGGPGWMKVQWAETTATDLTRVEFKEIATYASPAINYTPYLMPYCFELPAEMRGKANVVILFRCASQLNSKRAGASSLVTDSGTARLGHIEIVEIK